MNKRDCSVFTMEHMNDTYNRRWFLLARLFFVLASILLISAYTVQFSYAKD